MNAGENLGVLDGKVALVTGAAQGIGRGVALALAKAGAAVALVDTNESGLNAVAGEIHALGKRAIVLACDIRRRIEVEQAVSTTFATLGPVFVLVNNAIAVRHAKIEAITDEEMQLAVESGVYGSLYFMQACFPHMKTRGGRIVNFGSGAATMGMDMKGAYAVAKEGLRGLTKVAATEWGPYGITVNNIMPNVRTPLFDEWFESLAPDEQRLQMDLIPMRRLGDAESDVGALIVFLAGPGGGFITSRTLHIDGGRAYYDR
jgi:NAD(P)-dependent dehydrogenase (short-subunit alcohol dehydrogenase family)